MNKVSVFGSLSDLPLKEWNAIAKSHPYTYSEEFLEMMESSSTDNCYRGYGLIYDENDCIVALTHFSITRTDIAIFSSGWLRSALIWMRRLFPNFLTFRVLECALPIAAEHQPNAFRQHLLQKSFHLLGATLLDLAHKQGVFIVIIGPFEAQDHTYKPVLKDLGYQFAPCLPLATLDIVWETPSEYLAALKSYYRSKLQKHLRINQSNAIRHELRDKFDDISDVLWQQWLVVSDHAAEYNGEKLPPDFYKDFSLKFGERSKVILFYCKDELVGHALLLLDGDTLRWRNFGRFM